MTSPRSVALGATLLVATSALVGGCSSPSPASLEDAVRTLPGVVRVEAVQGGGDDGLPFATYPSQVTVRMDADSSQPEVAAVFDTYRDDIDDGDVGGLEVVLRGTRRSVLATGAGVQATDAMVAELVAAQHDDQVLRYRREAYPVLPSVYVTLVPLRFGQVVRIADRYPYAPDLTYVVVDSGDFALDRDSVNGSATVSAQREAYVRRVDAHVALTGALVTSGGPMTLDAAPSDVAALRSYVARTSPGLGLGPVVVRVER